MSHFVVLGLLICVALVVTKAADPFYVAPESTAVALMTNASFYCKASGHAVGWYLDGRLVNGEVLVSRNATYTIEWLPGGVGNSTFTILATHESNNSRVECAVDIINEGQVTSEQATLLVQGIPAAPGNFLVQLENEAAIQLKWNPPFTFEDVPLTAFRLYWINLKTHDTQNYTLPPNAFVYNFTVDDPSPCETFEFQISALNEAGEGNLSAPIQGHFLAKPGAISCEESICLAVDFFASGYLSVVLQVLVNQSCIGQVANSFIISMQSINRATTIIYYYNIDHTDVGSTEQGRMNVTLNATNVRLPLNDIYITTVAARNHAGISNFCGGFHISTFDVQDATALEVSPRNLCITCHFARGSEAQGCNVIILQTAHAIQILRDPSTNVGSECTLVLQEGTYNISVYDYEKDGSQAEFPAAVSVVVVTGTTSTGNEPDSELRSNPTFAIAIGSSAAGAIILLAISITVCYTFAHKKQSHNSNSEMANTEQATGDFAPSVQSEQAMYEASEQATNQIYEEIQPIGRENICTATNVAYVSTKAISVHSNAAYGAFRFNSNQNL